MKWTKHIANVFLAFTLLIATTGVTLHKHYCMGRLKAVAVNHSASPCSNEKGEPVEMPCCEDVSEELKVEDITQTTFDFDSQPDLFEVAFIQFFVLDQTFPIEEEKSFIVQYPPPIASSDYQVDYQVFLI